MTYSVTSGTLFVGDTLSGALARAPGEGLGTYAIGKGTLASLNYDVTFVGSTLVIEANPEAALATPSWSTTAMNAPVANALSVTNNSASPVASVYSSALPSAATAAGLSVNTNQPPLKIVRSRSGKGIVLEPAAPPQRRSPTPRS